MNHTGSHSKGDLKHKTNKIEEAAEMMRGTLEEDRRRANEVMGRVERTMNAMMKGIEMVNAQRKQRVSEIEIVVEHLTACVKRRGEELICKCTRIAERKCECDSFSSVFSQLKSLIFHSDSSLVREQ